MTMPKRTGGDPVNVPLAAQPNQVCPPVGSSVMVYNNDLTNVGYMGYSPGMTKVSGQAVQPLTYIIMDGTKAIYGFCDTGAPVLTLTPGGTYASPSPAQQAQQIALAGIGSPIPSLVKAAQTFNASTTTGPFNVKFVIGGSYLLVFNCPSNQSACADVTITHLDAAGNIVYQEFLTVACGAIGSFVPVIVRGNLQGTTLQITVTTCNTAYFTALGLINGPFTAAPMTMTIYSIAQAVAETRPKTQGTFAGGFIQGFQGVSLAAAASQGPISMPSYAGRVIADVFSAGTLARATIQGFTVGGGSAPQYTQRLNQIGVGATAVNEIIMPQKFCTLLILNGDAATRSITCNLFGADFL